MSPVSPIKKKAPAELQLVEGKSNPAPIQSTGEKTVNKILARTTDTRPHRTVNPAVVWVPAIAAAELAVLWADNGAVTAVVSFLVLFVVARLSVVNRRRARRAAHRANVREQHAIREALAVGNAHVVRTVVEEVAA